MSFARQNPSRFPTRREEEAHLIYQYSPIYTGNVTETPYEQVYLFPYYPESLLDKAINEKKESKPKRKKKRRKYRNKNANRK